MPCPDDKQTGQGENKRQDERFGLQAPVILSHFGTKYHREYASITFNLSKNGLCIEAAEAIRPGTTIYIRRGESCADENYGTNCDYLRSSSLGVVRWCRELTGKSGTYYCIGIKYY